MSLLVREMRRPRTLACPLLLTRSRTLFKLGYPQVMYGSQILSILVVALLSLMKTPLLIWSRRKSFRVLRTLGLTWFTLFRNENVSILIDLRISAILYPLIRTTKANRDS